MAHEALKPIVLPGVVLGIGLGGFVDGIVAHQILQWHNMLSAVVPPDNLVNAKVNMFWDGLFHAFTWLATALGVALLFQAGRRGRGRFSRRAFIGALALGWGLFNVVEGLIDHQLLGIHHVRQGAHQLAWDLGFLAFGAVLAIGGATMVRAARAPRPADRA